MSLSPEAQEQLRKLKAISDSKPTETERLVKQHQLPIDTDQQFLLIAAQEFLQLLRSHRDLTDAFIQAVELKFFPQRKPLSIAPSDEGTLK